MNTQDKIKNNTKISKTSNGYTVRVNGSDNEFEVSRPIWGSGWEVDIFGRLSKQQNLFDCREIAYFSVN